MVLPLAARVVRRTSAVSRPRLVPVLLVALAAVGCASAIPSSPAPSVTSVIVLPASPTLAVGDSVQLIAAGLDAGGVLVPNATFAWGSSNGAMASGSATGVVKALAPGGTVNITATAGSGVGTAVLNDTAAAAQ
jgi:uncharacterized protein YjdB